MYLMTNIMHIVYLERQIEILSGGGGILVYNVLNYVKTRSLILQHNFVMFYTHLLLFQPRSKEIVFNAPPPVRPK